MSKREEDYLKQFLIPFVPPIKLSEIPAVNISLFDLKQTIYSNIFKQFLATSRRKRKKLSGSRKYNKIINFFALIIFIKKRLETSYATKCFHKAKTL